MFLERVHHNHHQLMEQQKHSNLVRIHHLMRISINVFALIEMSAAEYREKLKAEQARKRDPRQDQNLSMKQKHDLIDRL